MPVLSSGAEAHRYCLEREAGAKNRVSKSSENGLYLEQRMEKLKPKVTLENNGDFGGVLVKGRQYLHENNN